MPDTTPPRWIALSWQLRESPLVTDGLSIGRIVQAGIEIADEHGLGGLSLRKLGEHLGAGTMAAYRHMRSKEELIHLMVDVAFGQPPEGIIEAADWRTGVRLWAAGMAERYRQHSWLLDAPLVAMSMTPNRLLWLDHILRPLGETGMDIQHLLEAALFVDGHVRHVAYLRRELRARTPSPRQAMPPWLSALLDDDSFPMARRVLAAGLLEDGDEQDMEFGLDWIIAGIEANSPRAGEGGGNRKGRGHGAAEARSGVV